MIHARARHFSFACLVALLTWLPAGCVRISATVQAEVSTALRGTQDLVAGCTLFYVANGRWPGTREEMIVAVERSGKSADVLRSSPALTITPDGESVVYRLTTARGAKIEVRMNRAGASAGE